MVMADPVADFLTRIRNANSVHHEKVEIPASGMKKTLAEIFKAEGLIKDYEFIEDGKQGILRLYLKYGLHEEKVITGIKRISRPGLRVYVKKDEVPRVLGGLGIAVISTSQGIMTDKEARKRSLGGEVICYVW
ncbi:MAG: 30S ribosomal protein S8 [Clostridia bacterium]|jgi:small subunit ribosomal protein S8|nr:30S ribosomal protein S8 [Clostridia bacterium]MDD4145721.1 30S ribosomal protein S8 [Clostridia bacterium]MDD4665295.1 30S ribosomal protein S8 [Clostridia bacterium]